MNSGSIYFSWFIKQDLFPYVDVVFNDIIKIFQNPHFWPLHRFSIQADNCQTLIKSCYNNNITLSVGFWAVILLWVKYNYSA